MGIPIESDVVSTSELTPDDKAPCILVDENETTLAAIARLVAHRAVIDAAIAEQVRVAHSSQNNTGRQRGWYRNAATWAEIGAALGTSGQAANQRYGK